MRATRGRLDLAGPLLRRAFWARQQSQGWEDEATLATGSKREQVSDLNSEHISDLNSTHVSYVNSEHVSDLNSAHVSYVNSAHVSEVNNALRSQHFRCFRSAQNHRFSHNAGRHGSLWAHIQSDSIPRVPGSLCKPSHAYRSPYLIKTNPNSENPENKLS